MTPADLTPSTLGAIPLSVLPPRRRTGARVKPFLFGVRAVERNKILRSRKSWAGGTVNSSKIGHPKGPARTILSYPSPRLPLGFRTAVRSIIRRTSLSRYKNCTVHKRLVFLNVVYSTKNLSIQDRAVHMKEENQGLILFFLFLEGEHSGAFIKILYCIQDHKWNAKQRWEGSELRNKSEASPLLTSL